MKLAERFISINGEGQAAGELAVFLRFAGCNLRCSYCDTAWANAADTPAEEISPEQLCAYVQETGIRNVTLTGGEPLLQPDMDKLITGLGSMGCRVEIETNGSIPIAAFAALTPRPCFTLDYKLPGSGMEAHMLTENYALLNRQDTVKFVSGSLHDLQRMQEIVQRFSLTEKCKVYISPVYGTLEPADIAAWMKQERLNGVRLQLQLHKYIWSPDTRGV